MLNFKNGLFAGIIVGGLYGLIKAPYKGKDTRQYLKNYLDQTTHDVNDVKLKAENLSQAIKRLSNEGLHSVKEASEEIMTSVNHFTEETQPRIRRVNEKLNDLNKDIEQAKSITNNE